MSLKIFPVQNYYGRFAEALCAADPDANMGRFQVMRFPNSEVCTSVREGVEGETCLLVGSISPPDGQILEFLMLADALRRAGAHSVRAFLPYLAYARQDKFSPGQSGGIATVGSLFGAAGIDGVITIDVHSKLDKQLMRLPIVSLMPAPALFVRDIQSLGWPDITVVAPDEGAIHRNQALADALGVKNSVAHLVKERTSIVHMRMVGEVGLHVVLADDILDSGRTLVSACNVLHQHGVKEIAIAVTHGLFTGEIWKELFGVGIKALFVTDTCPEALKTEEPNVRVVSIKPLLPAVLEAAKKEAHDESVVT